MLGKALAKSDWRCFGYAVMSNHIHLAMLAGRESLSAWTRRVNSPFALWMNQRRQRVGPLFAAAASDYAIAAPRESRLLAYIHRNPVRAGLVERASDSTWTSHQAFTKKAARPAWLHVDEALGRTGLDASEFDRFVDAEEGDSGEVAVDLLRVALRRRGALRVGTPTSSGAPVIARATGYWRPDPRAIVRVACELSQVSPQLVCSRRRIEEAISTRRAVAIAAASMGLSYAEIGDSLGISLQAVSKITRRAHTAEEMRLVGWIRERIELAGANVG